MSFIHFETFTLLYICLALILYHCLTASSSITTLCYIVAIALLLREKGCRSQTENWMFSKMPGCGFQGSLTGLPPLIVVVGRAFTAPTYLPTKLNRPEFLSSGLSDLTGCQRHLSSAKASGLLQLSFAACFGNN